MTTSLHKRFLTGLVLVVFGTAAYFWQHLPPSIQSPPVKDWGPYQECIKSVEAYESARYDSLPVFLKNLPGFYYILATFERPLENPQASLGKSKTLDTSTKDHITLAYHDKIGSDCYPGPCTDIPTNPPSYLHLIHGPKLVQYTFPVSNLQFSHNSLIGTLPQDHRQLSIRFQDLGETYFYVEWLNPFHRSGVDPAAFKYFIAILKKIPFALHNSELYIAKANLLNCDRKFSPPTDQ